MLPIAVAYALRQDLGYTRKDYQKIIHRASDLPIPQKRRGESRNERVYREISEACRIDWLHSPKALTYMKEKGEMGELAASEVLKSFGITKFKTEREQDKSGKTPDFLFDGLEKIPGAGREDLRWFESKATFGTLSEVKEDFKTQLSFYVGLFGSGAIVYWLGLTREAREFLEKSSEGKIVPFSGDELEKATGSDLRGLLFSGLER